MNRRLAIGLAVFLSASAIFAQSDLQPLAVVKLNKTETITLKQLKTRVEFVQRQYGVAFTPEQRVEVLESLIDEKLIVQAAAKEGLSVTDSQVNAAFLNTFSQQLGRQVSEAELEALVQQQAGKSLNDYLLESTGMGTADYKAYLKNQIIAQQYVYVKKQAEIQSVAATDAEIRSTYEMNKSGFVWADMVNLYLVMVPKASDATAARALATQLRTQYSTNPSEAAEAIVKDPRNGQAYQAGALIVQKSTQQAAQLGWSYDNIIELFSRSQGFVSEITETATDFQFYSIQKKYDAKMLSLSDVIQPETTITVYDYIKQNLTAQKQNAYFAQAAQELADSLDTAANVERKKTGADLTALLTW